MRSAVRIAQTRIHSSPHQKVRESHEKCESR